MVGSLLDPSAYVQRIKISAESRTQPISPALLEKAALERAPNYQHRDGRIYASRSMEPYLAVSVSPLNPLFDTQIEAGILPVVKALLERNYLPVSSCEGHNDSRSFVRIVFGSDQSANEFINEFGTMPYVTLTKLQTSANIIQWWQDGEPQWRAKYQDEYINHSLECQEINLLYKRNYSQVCYVDISLYDLSLGFWQWIKLLEISRDIKTRKHQRLLDIRDRILSMKDYEL